MLIRCFRFISKIMAVFINFLISDGSFTPNGCSIPGNLPFFYKKTFKPACDNHDRCYHYVSMIDSFCSQIHRINRCLEFLNNCCNVFHFICFQIQLASKYPTVKMKVNLTDHFEVSQKQISPVTMKSSHHE